MKTFLVDSKSNGTWFVGIYSNNFKDRQDEIITRQAHEDFAQWTKDNGIKPPIILFHLPQYPPEVHLANLLGLSKGIFTPQQYNDNMMTMYKATAIAQAEYIIPIDGFMVVLGQIFDTKVPIVKKYLTEHPEQWGMSHGFLGLKDGSTITKYFSHEFSILRESAAANSLTAVGIKETLMADTTKTLSEEDRGLLEGVLGENATAALEEGIQKVKEVLETVVENKSVDEPAEIPAVETVVATLEVTEEPVVEKGYETFRAQIMADLNIEGLLKALNTAAAQLAETNAKLETLENRMKALEVDEDTRIAAQFAVPDWSFGLSTAQKEADPAETELIEQLKKELPGVLDNPDNNVMQLAFGVLGAK
jgi:hypothetical protein